MKKKLYFLLTFFLLFALILPGCITFNFKTTIKPNGSGERTLDVAIDENFVSFVEQSTKEQGGKTLEEEFKKDLPKDAKFKTYMAEGKKHYETTFGFKDIEELKEINKKLGGNKQTPIAKNVSLDKKDLLFVATYTFTEEFPASSSETPKEMQAFAQAFTLNYTLTMPGKIVSANTSEIKDGTATWRLSMNKGGKITATSRYIRWWAIILAALLFLGIIVAVIIVILSSRKKTKVETPVSEEASES